MLQAHGEASERLSRLLRENGPLVSPELAEFAERTPLFHANPFPSKTDPRLLFHEDPWSGFDVVIGNPPYEALRESMSADEIKLLAERKRYRTTNTGNLYPLFCEAALALAKPEGGVVTMIVPLSIAFGQRERTLREVFETRCAAIDLRHYDNRPDSIFNASPTVKAAENRQRVTVVTARRGKPSAKKIRTTGLQRWPSEERSDCLALRRLANLPNFGRRAAAGLARQWPRVPTAEVAQMIQGMLKQKRSIKDYVSSTGTVIAVPKTAYLFLTALPEGTVTPRSESLFTVPDDAVDLILAVLNSQVAHGWWATIGDGFHVKLEEMLNAPVPDAWVGSPEPAALGQRLRAIIPDCLVENWQQGGMWRNVDFHAHAPDLIEEIDRLYIEALDLPVEPLLTHLRIMRSNRSWDFGGDGGEVPAYAGMTGQGGRLRAAWIPAYAGTTGHGGASCRAAAGGVRLAASYGLTGARRRSRASEFPKGGSCTTIPGSTDTTARKMRSSSAR